MGVEMIDFSTASDNMIQVLGAALSDVDWIVRPGGWDMHASFVPFQDRFVAAVRRERERRGLPELKTTRGFFRNDDWPFPKPHPRPNSWPVAPVEDIKFDVSRATRDELVYWHTIGGLIVDFSGMRDGVRDYVTKVWMECSDELERRGIPRDCYDDAQMSMEAT